MSESDFILELVEEREWRINELIFYIKLPHFYINSLFAKFEDTYFKMCIPMIYAHWEGFVVYSFRLLTEFINKQNITYQIAPEFLMLLANRSKFHYLKGNCDIAQQKRFLQEFLCAQKNSILLNSSECVSANSNLNFSQLKFLLNSFNMDITKKQFENYSGIEKLVKYRNSLAHGENISVSEKDISSLINCINVMIDEIIIQFKDYICSKKYLQR